MRCCVKDISCISYSSICLTACSNTDCYLSWSHSHPLTWIPSVCATLLQPDFLGTSISLHPFLLLIASRFREVISLALNGNYSGNALFDQESDLMYVTAVVNRNEQFADDIEKHGQSKAYLLTIFGKVGCTDSVFSQVCIQVRLLFRCLREPGYHKDCCTKACASPDQGY